MTVNLNTNNVNFGKRPYEIKGDRALKAVRWLGEDLTSVQQRLITAGTGIVLQPTIDLNNKNVDEKTRRTSCAKTISKILVGTTTGVIIRSACIKGLGAFTKNKNILKEEAQKAALKKGAKVNVLKKNITVKPWQQCLLPKKLKNSASAAEIKKYRGALGTFVALGVMLFTNFLIDAPGTTWFTNNVFSPLLNKKEGGNK